MEPELEQRLQSISHEHMILLLQELIAHHPALLPEMEELLERYANVADTKLDEEATEDWDFGRDELVMVHTSSQTVLRPLDHELYMQRLKEYRTRLAKEELPQAILDDLATLTDEAETRAEQHDYQNAMSLYALIIDERLAVHNTPLALIFDKAIDESMASLETLLSEASSNIMLDSPSSFSPMLTLSMRHDWLKRLFSLWLKRLDARRVEEHVPEIMLNVAWSDDVSLLQHLVHEELEQQPSTQPSNIVNFQREYRTRTLEKFLKELPTS